MSRPRRRRVYATGLTVWPLTGHDGLAIVWIGPGSGLYLAFNPAEPNGAMSRIEHSKASGTYDTRMQAESAVIAFTAETET